MKPTPMFAFVLMPFDRKFDDLYRLGIKCNMTLARKRA